IMGKAGPVRKNLERYLSDSSDDFRAERPLRAMLMLGSAEDEALIMRVLDAEKTTQAFVVKRALECLGLFGSKKSLMTIKKSFHRHGGYFASAYIKNACIHAVERITRRHGYRGSIDATDMDTGFLPTLRSYVRFRFFY
ncbi:MAG: hypothetical protein RIF32_18770, partial [Leptospirales bacterium]